MKSRALVFSDGTVGMEGDFPVAVVSVQEASAPDGSKFENKVTDPVFNNDLTRNLFGRVMTLVEATCEQHKLKSVKDLFARELREWEGSVYASAREIAEESLRLAEFLPYSALSM